ncbi:MAG: hypothetical protein A2096_01015 [Spirochaetes bacterium GWF1_41_5]|nr:MAG: hypothetical protein A2096_01015 [Spirochaetes bacterium GWF1_41_5]
MKDYIFKERIRGFADLCEKKKIKYKLVLHEDLEYISPQMLKNSDGAALLSEQLAPLFFHLLKTYGLKVPDNIRLISADGTSFCEDFIPKISTADHPFRRIALNCYSGLTKMIAESNTEFAFIKLKPTVTYRDTL